MASLYASSLCLLLLAGCVADASSATMPAPVTQCDHSEIRRLGDSAYSFRHGLYSTLFVVGEEGVIAFDPLGAAAECLSRAIQATAPGVPVRHVLYSHGHHDHVAGAASLPLGGDVRVYAHRAAAEELDRQGKSPEVLPVTDVLDISSAEGMPTTLALLGQRFDLYYAGPTESGGNLTVLLPDQQVALLVDVLIADTVPGTVLASVSPQGTLRTLRLLDQLPFRHLVTGHGPTATHDDVSRTLAFWDTYVSLARLQLAEQPPVLTDDDALEGAPLLKVLQQLPLQKVLDDLRPYYGQRTGFERWGHNGFNFVYLLLRSEATDALPPADVNRKPAPPTNWQKVGDGTYLAQAGPYGSLVFDPDPAGGTQPLLIVDTLGEYAPFLRQSLQANLPGRAVGHIVYSHAHNDHIANAAALVPGLRGVRIYAHENAARDLADRGNPSVAPPTDLVRGAGMDLPLGTARVRLLWFGPSHTDGNLVVFLPAAQVAMGVGLLQKGGLPGLLSVATDPLGLYATLTGMSLLPAQVYLTGQGGPLLRPEFLELLQATRELLGGAAQVLNRPDLRDRSYSLEQPVAPALRDLVDGVGDAVATALTKAHPALRGPAQIAGNFGELGLTYCASQSPSVHDCRVP